MENIKLRFLLLFFILLGTLNYGFMCFDYNIIYNNKIIYAIIAICGLLILYDRNMWLPFLSPSILPSHVLPLQTPQNANLQVSITTQPNTKIVYWASNNKDVTDVSNAYNDYSNSGVVLSDDKGVAILPIVKGNDYIVDNEKIIKKHVHYRLLGGEYEIMGEVNTVNY